MAGIDKIYGTFQQLVEYRAWCRKHGRWVLRYADTHTKADPGHEVAICNNSQEVDWFLYTHCPLGFVQDRLRQQYSGPPRKSKGSPKRRRYRDSIEYAIRNSWRY